MDTFTVEAVILRTDEQRDVASSYRAVTFQRSKLITALEILEENFGHIHG